MSEVNVQHYTTDLLCELCESLRDDLITYLDGQPNELITGVCDVIIRRVSKTMTSSTKQLLEIKQKKQCAAEAEANEIFSGLPKDVVRILYFFLQGKVPRTQVAAMIKQINDIYEREGTTLLVKTKEIANEHGIINREGA